MGMARVVIAAARRRSVGIFLQTLGQAHKTVQFLLKRLRESEAASRV